MLVSSLTNRYPRMGSRRAGENQVRHILARHVHSLKLPSETRYAGVRFRTTLLDTVRVIGEVFATSFALPCSF